MVNAPEMITRLLKSYDLEAMSWEDDDSRYMIVVEILTKGMEKEKAWLAGRLSVSEVRSLIISRRGQCLDEEQRRRIRREFDISTDQLPLRDFIEWK